MRNLLSSLFSPAKKYKIQSFTFFIPSPPARSTGYREKQFDKLFYEFINKGYKILNFTTQASTGEKQSGMWIVVIVQALNEEAEQLNLNEFLHDSYGNAPKDHPKNSIEGLYYIDDRASEND